MRYMFSGCSSLNNLPDISKWDTKNVKDMSFMFSRCRSLNNLPDISKWDIKSVKYMNNMFSRCSSLNIKLNISKWDTKHVKDMNNIFDGYSSLNILPDISKLDKIGNKHNNKAIKKKKEQKEINQVKEIKNENIQTEEIKNTNKKIKKIYEYNILFVGEAHIGTKTSLIKRIKTDKFIDNLGDDEVNREKIEYEKNNNKIILYLIDTNAENDKKSLEDQKVDFNNITNYYENADCIIMGYDITNKQSFEKIKSFWFNKIKEKNKTNLIYLLGNKMDLKDNIEVNENEIYKFTGINKIKHFSISVKNDINIQNLIDDIKINIEIINNGINRKPKESFKVVFLGDSGVGSKTSFIARMVKGDFDSNVPSTSGASYCSKKICSKNGNSFIINLWDTAGQERYISLTKFFCLNADCIVLGYDITRKGSFESIKSDWYPKSKKISGASLFYLIGNKSDLIDQEEVSELEAREYAKYNNMRFFLTSCLKNTGIKEFVEDLAEELEKF